MKICKACLITKLESEFYKLKTVPYGLTSQCKECVKIRTKRNRSEKADYYKEYDRKRANLPHRVKAREKYALSDRGKKVLGEVKREWILRNKEKRRAHLLVQYALKKGDLKRPNECEKCRKVDLENSLQGHHDDYTKPLEIVWMCTSCHSEHHKNDRHKKGTHFENPHPHPRHHIPSAPEMG